MTDYTFTEEQLENILHKQHFSGYQQGRRDMLVTMQQVVDSVRAIGFVDFDIDEFFAGITLGLMKAEDLDNDG